jgi:tetratricopeptide (TPR) repeat protein
MYKNNYIINKHDNFEKDENLWIFKNPNNSYSHGAFHGISVNWDDRGEFLFPMKEIDRYHSIITSSKRSDSEKIHLWRLFVDNLTYATLIDSTNPLIWFTLGEIFDDINYIASTNNFSKLGETLPRGYRLKDTRRVVHPYEKVLELDSFFNPKNLNSKKFKYFNLVDSYSKIISQWCATAHFFNILGKSDSAKYAYNKAFEKVGTDHPFIEYGRNILRSCDQNSILFTNGDNDTYPLWYLQEIENFRKDVTVINLSLLQTKWYIRKVVNSNPEFSRLLKLTDKEIDQLPTSIGWEKQNIKISAKNETGWIEWECKPTHNDNALLLKDIMVLRIIDKMAWEFPIYFALTVSSKSWLGLNDYLPMEGMVFHLLDVKSQQINPTKTQENLAKYTYESIDNPLTEIYLGPLMRNYHSIYVQLVVNYYMDYIKLDKKISKQKVVEQKRQKVEEILNEMFIKLPNEKIPYDPNLYYQCAMLYYNIGNNEKAKGILKEIIDTDPDNQNANDILVKINQGD